MADIKITPPKHRGNAMHRPYVPPVRDGDGRPKKSKFSSPTLGMTSTPSSLSHPKKTRVP